MIRIEVETRTTYKIKHPDGKAKTFLTLHGAISRLAWWLIHAKRDDEGGWRPCDCVWSGYDGHTFEKCENCKWIQEKYHPRLVRFLRATR